MERIFAHPRARTGKPAVWMGTEPPVSCAARDRPALFGYRFRCGNSDHEIRRKSERRRASQIRCDGACTLPAKPTSVLVIGIGGGRDILTSLAFGQRHVTGVEINPDILRLLTRRFGQYSGSLQNNPDVTLVHDEARSYVARSLESYGIIQASLIDTWDATSAGAYVLTENGLYTKEAR